MSNDKFSKEEMIAAGTSLTIIAIGLIFWIVQIRGVMEMLELAYG